MARASIFGRGMIGTDLAGTLGLNELFRGVSDARVGFWLELRRELIPVRGTVNVAGTLRAGEGLLGMVQLVGRRILSIRRIVFPAFECRLNACAFPIGSARARLVLRGAHQLR